MFNIKLLSRMKLDERFPANIRDMTSSVQIIIKPDTEEHLLILFNDITIWLWASELTLKQPLPWASGLPVAIQCAWFLDLSVHWNTAGERIVGSQCISNVLPVVFFQWSSSVFQINTGLPLEHHWVLASASVVPVASQCTYGSSGLPVWSVQWYPSVLTESGLEVIRSGHFPACNPLCFTYMCRGLYGLSQSLQWCSSVDCKS